MTETYLETLILLASLEYNWDGYGAAPINPAAIDAAKKFLVKNPEFQNIFIGPSCQGNIVLELSLDDVDLILEFDGETVEIDVDNMRLIY